MAGLKNFLIIPILVIAYIFFVNMLVQMTPAADQASQSMSGGSAQTLGFGDTVSISVTRPYFFGMIRLPVYSPMFGDIGFMHDIFTYFIIVLTAIFIIQETKYNKKRRGVKMAKKTGTFDWKGLLMPIVWGFLFMFLAFLLSGDYSSIVIGLLVMYLEYKLRK